MRKILSILVAAILCTSLSAQQINEGFDATQFPPEGWTVENIDNYSGWKRTELSSNGCAVVNGTYGSAINGSYLITPALKPASGEKLSFSARVSEFASKGELRIEVSTTGTETSTFTILDTYYTSSTATTNKIPKSDWKTFSIDLSSYVGQRIFIAFHQYNDAEKIYLDDIKGVTIAGSETCEAPTDLTVSDVTGETAVITWEGTAEQYQYVLMLAGETPDWQNAPIISAKTVTFNQLDEETAYDFYVRASCAGGEVSLAPKTSFKTACEAQTVPWIETFTRDATGAVEPDCWIVSSAKPQVWVVADKTENEEGETQVVYGQAHLAAAGGGTNTVQVFAMPAFDAELDTLELAFDYKNNVVSDNYGKLEIGYMTNPANAATFVSLKTLDQTLEYAHEVYPLTSLPAEARYIAFRYAGGTSDLGSVSMDNFVLAGIGHSQDITPEDENLPDAGIWGLTYCEAQFTWYSYNADAFAIAVFSAEQETPVLIGGIVASTGECDRFAYTDGIQFSQDDDYENHYYCSTKWILNADDGGVQKGDAWANCVINVGTAVNPQLGLKPGKYTVLVYKYVAGAGLPDENKLATINFELVSKEITNLKAVVAENKQTATLTWEQPALSTGERLYVDIRAGETVAYNNFETKQKATSPLIVDVIEGKSYTAIFQIIDKDNNPLGSEVTCDFTVGVNNYEPKNLKAEVFGGDNVTFTWEAETAADFYDIVLYADGDYYTTLSVYSMTKTTTMPKDATWSWTVQPFTQGTTGKYFPACNPVAGNDFVSKGAEIPEDAIQMNVWGMEAGYLDENESQFPAGKYSWMVMLATGEEGGTGYPMPWFLIHTDKQFAISGVYNVARGNIDLESTYINTNGTQAGCIMATDAELRLQFEGYDEEKFEQGYAYAYYTGSFRIVTTEGKTYVGKIFEQFCNSFNFSTYGASIRDHVGMWEEEYDIIEDGVENVLNEAGFDLQTPMYNIMGVQVDPSYKGIVIQNGKKMLLQ